MQFVSENLPLVLGVALGVLFVTGLVLALRTEGGRDRLAAAAVRLAVAALGFAEKWLGQQVQPAGLGSVEYARGELQFWLKQRTGEVARDA